MVAEQRLCKKMTDTTTDVAVIGGGASGMAAGLFSAKSGASTLILEKNDKLGRKMYITGKGRCNLTNDATLDEFLREVPRNPKFLYSALALLSPQDTMRLVTQNGCPVKTERGRRVFPVSDKASDVTKAWHRALDDAGCGVRLNACVQAVLPVEQGYLLTSSVGRVYAKALVIATGGLSYPSTGSTGDGDHFAEALGVPLQPRSPVLVPMLTSDPWTGQLQGLSLKNVRLNAVRGQKTLFSELGEMLFTHDGISGPLVLELSCHLDASPLDAVETFIDLKPGLTHDQLRERLDRDIRENGRRQLRTILDALLPGRLSELMAGLSGLSPTLQASQLTKQQREALTNLLKHFRLHLSGTHPLAEAIVTRGGVDTKALLPATMAVRSRPSLFFCGEMIDVDAHTGGYNLQIAFATGALAGQSAAAFALNIPDRRS